MDDAPRSLASSVLTHYSESGNDYAAWSSGYNMHFGYYKVGFNPLDRERMLEEMTRQVTDRLELVAGTPARVADLGCGVGAPSRTLVRSNTSARVVGVTIVPWQVEKAKELAADLSESERINFVLSDFTRAGLRSRSFDAGYAIESACHDVGLSKEGFASEAARLLKPGARLVIADGFLKGTEAPPRWLQRVFETIYEHWALATFARLGSFIEALERSGFVNVHVEEISWRVAPSALHIPWVSLKFLVNELVVRRTHLTRARWGHVLASMAAPIVGAARRYFGYHLVTATRGTLMA